MSKYAYRPPKPQTASTGTFKEIGLEDDVIIQRISKDMYADPASCVRELMANEICAAIIAKKAGANPRIEATITPDKICIQGIDSLGMTREIFEEVYSVLGRSTNTDGKLPGQFGLGRASYTAVSDHMLLETHCRNGDCYSVLGVEGKGYQTGLSEPDIPYGTRITMTPRKHGDGLDTMVRLVARRSPIPITLITVDGTERLEHTPLGHRESPFVLTGSLPEVEFAVNTDCLGVCRGETALCGMPIEFTYRGRHPRGMFSVNILDERAFAPTPDRERMTEQAEIEISGIIDREIARQLKDYPRDITEVLDRPDRWLAIAFLSEEIPELHQRVKTYRPKVRGWKPWNVDAEDEMLYRLPGRPILNCKTFNVRQINAIRRIHYDAVFVRDVPALQSVDDFMAQHGIKPEPKPTIMYQLGKRPTRIDPKNPPAVKIYRVAAGELRNSKSRCHRDAALTAGDVVGAEDFMTAKKRAQNKLYETSKGVMTGGQLLTNLSTVYPTQRRSLLKVWGDGPEKYGESVLVYTEVDEDYRLLMEPGLLVNPFRYEVYIRPWGGDEEAIEKHLRKERGKSKAY